MIQSRKTKETSCGRSEDGGPKANVGTDILDGTLKQKNIRGKMGGGGRQSCGLASKATFSCTGIPWGSCAQKTLVSTFLFQLNFQNPFKKKKEGLCKPT